ncbi:MAG: VCBS repeat-containing protein, partial [Calditrichaeota bacterium]|nr:VCBS repeat-containing protein [Calditrichota bacterium]
MMKFLNSPPMTQMTRIITDSLSVLSAQIRVIRVICVLLLFSSAFAQSTWTENSFQDFIDGQFLDAGSNLYVSAKGRIQIINRWDFNGDGYLDVLLPAGHGHTEKENTYIYFNNGKDIDARSRIELPGCGSSDGLVADFNKDGFNDIAIANSADSHYRWVDAWIYYGSEKGFSAQNRAELPAFQAKSIAAGDFNGNGWLDLAIACQWQAGTTDKPEGPQMSFIYWNSSRGFQPENRLPLVFDGKGAKAFAAADLDGDGKDDLIATATGNTYILLSGQKAFRDSTKRAKIPLSGSAIAIGNVNKDAFLDFAICSKNGVVVLFGSETKYSLNNSSKLLVDAPSDVVLADINQDGFDDVIVANNKSPIGATWVDSYIFLADNGKFSDANVIKLPTLAATGVSAGDLNGDGFPEVVFSNQRVTNQLNICSYVYWND